MKSWSAPQELISITCEFLNYSKRSFSLPVESIDFSPAGFSSQWRCSITWTQNWGWLTQVKNKALLSPTGFFNEGKPERLVKAAARWYYLFMFKKQEPLKGVTVWNSFPVSDWNQKKTSWAQTHSFSFLGKLVLTQEEMPAIRDH